MKVEKVMFGGFPMRFEWREGANAPPTLCGFWRFVPLLLSGKNFFAYGGSYIEALVAWLFEPAPRQPPAPPSFK